MKRFLASASGYGDPRLSHSLERYHLAPALLRRIRRLRFRFSRGRFHEAADLFRRTSLHIVGNVRIGVQGKPGAISYNPEAFLPEEVRNAIYDDMRWFDRAKYLPEGSDEDPLMYVSKELDEGLHELTELQREILFRTVINRESTESVARDKQCSSRNIRDIRARALRQLKSKITRREGSGSPVVLIIVLLCLFACYFGIEIFVERLLPLYPWLEYVGYAIAAAIAIPVVYRFKDREIEGLLRNHWASRNGSRD